jgi:large subunit ribosomal protein L10
MARKKEDKNKIIDSLMETIGQYRSFYIADISNLTVEKSNALRRKCFNSQVKLRVAKNKLIRKALERMEGNDYSGLFPVLKGSSALMFSETVSMPARVIKEFRQKHDKPLLKAAFIDSAIYLGDHQLDMLAAMKSKEELLADIISLLQSPVRNVMAALHSAGHTLSGLLTSLEKRNS